jgi:NAD(P)H-flavin reductase
MTHRFIKPQNFKGIIVNTTQLNHKDKEVVIKLVNPETISASPGQFISVEVSENTFRSYSIANLDKTNQYLTLVVEIEHEGVGANYFKNLEIDAKVNFIGPSGKFLIPDSLKQNLVFIATGTGLAPIYAILCNLADRKIQNNISLLFGVRTYSDTFFIQNLENLKSNLPNFIYTVYLSKQTPLTEQYYCKQGRVTQDLDYFIKNNTQYFVCGNPNMVTEVISQLLAKNISSEDIIKENFTTNA